MFSGNKLSLIILALGLTSTFLVSAFSEEQNIPAKLQWKTGVPLDEIYCKNSFTLIVKNSDSSPACVSKDTAMRLLELGWAKTILEPKTRQVFSDTWNEQGTSLEDSSIFPSPGSGGFGGGLPQFSTSESLQGSSTNLGFSVGGAKDIDNFRENIQNDFLPLYSDVTYEGLFYDYYFDTGEQTQCLKLFCPSYSYAVSEDPFSKEEQHYLSVGLNSGLKEKDFQRKNLNLVIVLDVSGSMSSPFDQYYYDNPHGKLIYEELTEEEKNDFTKSKMQLASESIVALVDHLDEEDNLGIVLFNNNAHISKPLESLKYTDIDGLKENIFEIRAGGGTNLNSGMIKGSSLFDEVGKNPGEYENRIIFLTDAMPNISDISPEGLLGKISKNSQQKIYTTFIGIGLDFNTELIEKISKVKGVNYYSVHSSFEFKERMDEEFEFMVTPLVFDLVLRLESDGFSIEEVYGSPDANKATGEIMNVSTLFPSKTQDGETRGGVILIKLEKLKEDSTIHLKTSYEDRNGIMGQDSSLIVVNNPDEDFYDNSGIQKAVLLSRYANLMKTWAFDERSTYDDIFPFEPTPDFYSKGLYLPDYIDNNLGKWERESIPLQISEKYVGLISEFLEYYDVQTITLDDSTLDQERQIMKKLVNLRT